MAHLGIHGLGGLGLGGLPRGGRPPEPAGEGLRVRGLRTWPVTMVLPWENHGKTMGKPMGKPWEHGGFMVVSCLMMVKMVVSWWFDGIYPLVNVEITMENHHF